MILPYAPLLMFESHLPLSLCTKETEHNCGPTSIVSFQVHVFWRLEFSVTLAAGIKKTTVCFAPVVVFSPRLRRHGSWFELCPDPPAVQPVEAVVSPGRFTTPWASSKPSKARPCVVVD